MLQLSRHHLSRSRRLLALLLASTAAVGCGIASAQEPPTELQLQAPMNSTLEIRVARRPWLLEKLRPKTTEPSVKMNPPTPPALQAIPDPPSISRDLRDVAESAADGWVRRDAGQTSVSPESAEPDGELPAREDGELGSLIRLKPMHPDTPPLPLEVTEERNGPPVDVAPTPKDNLLRAESPSQPPSIDSDRIEVGPIIPPNPTGSAKANPQESPPKDAVATEQEDAEPTDRPAASAANEDKLTVRELRIDRDGTPREDQTASPVAKPKPKSDAVPSGISQFVGTDPDLIAKSVRLDYAGYPATRFRLSSTVARMRPAMQQTLQHFHNRPEVANERSNWGMLHAIMVYGVDTRILVGNRSYSAIAWIAGNNACRGQKLLSEGPRGIVTKSGIGLQGHQAQMLAVFSLCDVPISYPIYADENRYTIRDVVEAEMGACRSGEELTFTLIGLAHYLDTDAVWVGGDGQRWDFERLIREELSQPIVGAACGGTHRLMGFAHALRKRRAEGRPITGQWKRAEMFSQDFVRYTYRLQNRDGSMSTDWFEGREDNGNLDRKIQTTGHMVEWLLTLTPDAQLQDPRLVRAIRFLLNSIHTDRDYDWKIGPKGHALRSLAMYYERVYQRGPAWRPRSMAHTGAAHR